MTLRIYPAVIGVIPEAFEFKMGPDYAGRHYDRFHVARDAGYGPGWYVWGRNPEYGDHLVCRVAQPNVKPRRHPHFNGRVRRGFHLKRDAEMVADFLNEIFPKGTGHDDQL